VTKLDCQIFDFDEWAELAKADPAAFEERRRQAIDDLVARAPVFRRRRLRCTQWRVDRVREQCQTPLSACLKLQNLMWDSVYSDAGLMWGLEGLVGSLQGRQHKPPRSAKVLAFPPGQSSE
jgi:hypothetical protein